jgi:hypothetical protein
MSAILYIGTLEKLFFSSSKDLFRNFTHKLAVLLIVQKVRLIIRKINNPLNKYELYVWALDSKVAKIEIATMAVINNNAVFMEYKHLIIVFPGLQYCY